MSLLSHASAITRQFDLYESRGRSAAACNGPLIEDIRQKDICAAIALHRFELAKSIAALSPDQFSELLQTDSIYIAADRMRGSLYDYVLPDEERRLLDRQMRLFLKNWARPECFGAFIILSLYEQPFDLPLHKQIDRLDLPEMERYLASIMRQPHLMSEQDEDKYLTYYAELTSWLLKLIEESDNWDAPRQAALLRIIKQRLTFGACYYLDRPIIDIVKKRAQIIEAVVQRDPSSKTVKAFYARASAAPGRAKLRLGILSRNIADYTDTRALYALFHAFDPDRYEIYWYTLDILDPSSLDDAVFKEQIATLAHKIISLRGDATAMAKTILADDLDIFAVGTGYSFSVKDIDQMLFHRLGRIQIALSELISGSSGLASYDYFFVPQSDPDVMQIYRQESTEKLLPITGPVLWYEKRPKADPSPAITREKLNIPKDAVLYCSGAAANKQMAGTLHAWFKILQRVPSSYLLLYPFNPAWGGYFIGLTFMARLRSIMRQFPDIAMKRIIAIRQVTPQDGNRLIQLSDIYLGSFPRGGATSAMLALRHGKPVVARREKWLHSHDDAVLLRSLSCQELIGSDNDAMIDIAVKLGVDAHWRQQITQRIEQSVENAPFFDITSRSREFQAQFDAIAGEGGLMSTQATRERCVTRQPPAA